MNLLQKIFGNAPVELNKKDMLAEFLKTTPEALNQFERSYAAHVLSKDPEGFFQTNSRQAAAQRQIIDYQSKGEGANAPMGDVDMEYVEQIKQRIVDELLAQTKLYVFDGRFGSVQELPALPEDTQMVTNEELKKISPHLRPELTGNLMKVDIPDMSAEAVLWHLFEFVNAKTDDLKVQNYHQFRQGLDILDLDEITYEIIGTNQNSMGIWLPKLVEAVQGTKFFKIPKTAIAKVPLTLLQLTRQEYMGLTPSTIDIVDRWAFQAFRLDETKEYFIKTGTYSSKFDFRNARVAGAKEVRELGEYLLYIHFQALQMASSFMNPRIYGASTTNEWVVREYIPDKENNPCIYKGLPLHTEYRVFVDCDTDQVIGVAPYWEPEGMLKRFGHELDADSPHNIHDYIIYKAHEDTLMERFYAHVETVKERIQEFLPYLDLQGQWSIDVMQNGDEFWLIDMALAAGSTFFPEYVPDELKCKPAPGWLPGMPPAFNEVYLPASVSQMLQGLTNGSDNRAGEEQDA